MAPSAASWAVTAGLRSSTFARTLARTSSAWSAAAVDGGLRLRHAVGGHGQRGAGALGADDDALEGAVGPLGEGLPVEDVGGRRRRRGR